MLMTLEDAASCWCPFVRLHYAGIEVAFNRQLNNNKDTGEKTIWHGAGVRCLGNECAAWRWKDAKPIADIDLVTGDVEKPKRLGYCGLSGPASHED